jgi:hypothetical protein
MSKKAKIILALAISLPLLIAAVLQWSWFHVDGSELTFLDTVSGDCTGLVTVQTWDNRQWEQEMTDVQIAQLLDLLKNGTYWRETENLVSGNWSATYFISLNFTVNDQHQYLSFQICGDTTMLIHGSNNMDIPKGYLMIRSDGWQETLDTIFPAP